MSDCLKYFFFVLNTIKIGFFPNFYLQISQLLSKIRDLSDRKQIGEDLPLKAENGSEQIDRVAYPRLKS